MLEKVYGKKEQKEGHGGKNIGWKLKEQSREGATGMEEGTKMERNGRGKGRRKRG